MTNKIIFFSFVLFYYGCANKMVSPEPSENKIQAEKSSVKFETKGNISGINKNFETLKSPLNETNKQSQAKYNTGKPGWISIEKKKYYNSNTSFKDAKIDLLKEMRNDAISKKVGTTVEITQLLSDVISQVGNESFSKTEWSGFFKSTVSGIIIDEQEIDSKINTEKDELYQYSLHYKFYVDPVTGNRDLDYRVDTNLKNNVLNDGDELEIYVTPTKDSYVYVFNLMADNNTILMFPNEYMTENKIKAEEKLTIPEPSLKRYISFIVASMPDTQITSESIYVICTKQEVPIPDQIPRIGEKITPFPIDGNSFLLLQKWLNNIPLDQRIESLSIYHVSK